MKAVVPAWMKPICDAFAFPAAVVDGDYVRCSGVIGFKPDLSVPDDPAAQFTLAFENLRSVLEESGVGFADIVEMNTYHVGLQANLQTFVEVKSRFLSPPYPAWTAIGITELALPGGIVEIQVTARRRK
jgi:enamine deaminase RidA (YjgF/YER057c/UK114 family)